MKNSISLFWWSEPRIMGKEKENYGDLLSKYLVEKISGEKVAWIQPRKVSWYRKTPKHYLAAGSIIHHASKKSIVWGSGIIDRNQNIANADFRAVRGPETRKYLLQLGYECPKVYGDPALLLPDYFKPIVKKKYKFGVIPHYNDFDQVSSQYGKIDGLKIIDMMTFDIEETTKQILECEKIISSSLHGVIIAHAYGLPALSVKFSDRVFGDGIKYVDYYSSLGYEDFQQTLVDPKIKLEFEKLLNDVWQPSNSKMDELKKSLLKNCPFKDF